MGFAKGTRRFRRDTQNLAARLRVIVFTCEGCGLWGGPTKPAQCKSCGSMAFLRFDSKAEAERWATLRLYEAQGLINTLRRQTRHPLHACRAPKDFGGDLLPIEVGHYVSDFDYYEADGRRVVEDTKGDAITDLAAWKLRHFHAQYGFEVRLVKGVR